MLKPVSEDLRRRFSLLHNQPVIWRTTDLIIYSKVSVCVTSIVCFHIDKLVFANADGVTLVCVLDMIARPPITMSRN